MKTPVKKVGAKGVSPVIATVLLIGMTIVIALIVFLWFRDLGGEAITKFGGQNVEMVCGDVEFNAEYVGGRLKVSNTGNVPIFGMNVKIESPGSHETKEIKELDSNWNPLGLDSGGVFTSNSLSFGSAEKIILIPILLGASEKGQKTYVCDEKQYGYEIIL